MQFYEIKKFLPAVVEMFAQYIPDIFSLLLHGIYHKIFDHRQAAPATSARFGTFFNGIYGLASLFCYRLANSGFGYAFTTADQRIAGKCCHAGALFLFSFARR